MIEATRTFIKAQAVKIAAGVFAALLLALAGTALWGHFGWKAAESWKRTAGAYKLTLKVSEDNWRAASAEAKRRAEADVAKVNKERETLNARYQEQLALDRASADARYRRLRASAEAYRVRADKANLSSDMESTCRAFAGTGCDAIPALLKAAQDNTDQLLALIGAVKAQSEITVELDEAK